MGMLSSQEGLFGGLPFGDAGGGGRRAPSVDWLDFAEVDRCDERGFNPASCHTFTLNAPGWSGSSVPFVCPVRNDRTNGTEWVRVDGAGPNWTRLTTQADSEDAFKQGSYLIGECRPE